MLSNIFYISLIINLIVVFPMGFWWQYFVINQSNKSIGTPNIGRRVAPVYIYTLDKYGYKGLLYFAIIEWFTWGFLVTYITLHLLKILGFEPRLFELKKENYWIDIIVIIFILLFVKYLFKFLLKV